MKDGLQFFIHHPSRPFSRFLPEVAVDAEVMEDVCSSSESDIRESGRADAHLLANLAHGTVEKVNLSLEDIESDSSNDLLSAFNISSILFKDVSRKHAGLCVVSIINE